MSDRIELIYSQCFVDDFKIAVVRVGYYLNDIPSLNKWIVPFVAFSYILRIFCTHSMCAVACTIHTWRGNVRHGLWWLAMVLKYSPVTLVVYKLQISHRKSVCFDAWEKGPVSFSHVFWNSARPNVPLLSSTKEHSVWYIDTPTQLTSGLVVTALRKEWRYAH